MFGFAIVAMAPALLISRMISPRKQVTCKIFPMECGQVPSGAGRTHFMMQYYAFILMFVVFDVMAIFLYAWGSTILNLKNYNSSNHCIFRNNVWSNGICTLSIKEARYLVIINTNSKS